LSTNRIKLVVAYDGTDFRGWAAQTGQRTVQSTLKDAVRQVSGEDCEIVGASRTDSGAHAKGQVCHFDTCVPIEPKRWAYALNRLLPSDLAVIASRKVPKAFHSRFCAADRRYRYRIAVGGRDPHRDRYRHWYGRELDVRAMQTDAEHLLGAHDFKAFSEEIDDPETNTQRTLFRAAVRRAQDEVQVDLVGTAFLRGMVRRISGALLEIGRGKRQVGDIELLLDPKNRDSVQWPVVLPACGLTLMRVRYTRPLKDNRLLQQQTADELADTGHENEQNLFR
jgi:tRNA pseudouridine38-40 synthase